MNWDAISAIAEVTGTIGVIISLIYLGLQIRSQTVEARITGLDNAVGELNNIYESLAGDEKFAALFLKALQDFDGFSDVERVQFSAHLSRFMRGAEAMFHPKKMGSNRRRSLCGNQRRTYRYLQLPRCEVVVGNSRALV